MLWNLKLRSIKLGVLAALTLGGGVMATSCGLGDLKDNMAAGTLGYVKTATGEFWSTVLPKWSTILQSQGT